MTQPHWPPLDGSLTVIPGFLDFHAERHPERAWALFPSRTDPTQAESISFGEFAKASHRFAHLVRPGRAGKDGEVVTLLIHCDTILYLAVLTGLIRAGIVPLPVSPRNSPEAVANLIEKTGSRRLIISESLAATADKAQEILTAKSYEITVDNLVPLHDIFPTLLPEGQNDSPTVEPYPASDKPYDPDELVLILHSSGSTGLPKPIPMTRKIMLQWAASSSSVRGRDLGIRWGSMVLPSFHTMGISIQLLNPLTSGNAIGVYTPMAPNLPVVPNPENFLEAMRVTECTGTLTVPSIIESWAQNPEHVEFLSKLKLIMYAGGPLSAHNGTKLMKAGVPLHCVYGLTECGAHTKGYCVDDSQGPDAPWKTSADWEWIQLAEYVRPRWVPQGDGTYELQFLTCETHQPSIENLPDVKGYATSDLWEPHPTKKDLWRIVGRKDDVVVLGSGEKIVPIPQENHLVSSPYIAGAVMFGWGKLQPGVLVEPTAAYAIKPNDEGELIKYRNLIWPVVEEANRHGPTFARIFKETIVVADPARPLPRAAKGTVIRKQALALYAEEIEKMYRTVEESSDVQGISPPASWEKPVLENWLAEHAASLNNGSAPAVSADIFAAGFDSLSATILRNRIIGALRSSQDTKAQQAAANITQNFIFDHPTIEQLAQAVAALLDPASADIVQKDPAEEIAKFIEKYSAILPERPAAPATDRSGDIAVLLTGSTGNLGSHTLAALLADPRVVKVYTFDRASADSTPRQRIESAFKDRGLPVELLSQSKLSTLVGDLNKPSFGLDSPIFEELKQTITHVVHNAWNVNFNHPLASFEGQIAGTRKLVDFAFSAKRQPKLLFTSSISAAHGWDTSNGPVPEEPLPDPKVATSSGYASSKFVVEQILAQAAQHGIEATSLRVGQVCGSKTTGAWNTTDWVPILVKSGLSLKALPVLDSAVDWIPMDVVGGAILDLVTSQQSLPPVVNVVHPRPTPWRMVFQTVRDALDPSLPLVPYHDWLAKLEALSSNPSAAQLEAIPALKLLQFLGGIGSRQGPGLEFSTSKLQSLSATVQALEPLDEGYAQSWVRYWRAGGFIA